MQGCVESSVGKVLAAEARGPGFNPQHLHKIMCLGVITCDPSTEELETGRSMGLPGHKSNLLGIPQVPERDPTSKSKMGSY